MPTKFYHLVLESGKDFWVNPDHIMFAQILYGGDIKGVSPQWELTMANGYKIDFSENGGADNRTLAAKITAKHPA